MTAPGALYRAGIVHRRFHPVSHELSYRATYLLVDVDRLDEVAGSLRLLARDAGPGLLRLRDRDLGPAGTGNLATRLRSLLAERGHLEGVERIEMLAMPRMLGYAFNPLTTYYAYGPGDLLRLMVYEVSNTFGERCHYVVPVEEGPGIRREHSCHKSMAVSPFNDDAGQYGFTFMAPHDNLRLTVSLWREGRRILSAYLHGEKRPLSDREILLAFLRDPIQSYRVIGGIHREALVLWRKGLRIARRNEPGHGLVAAAGRGTGDARDQGG